MDYLGIIGAIVGVSGFLFTLITIAKNNSRWTGIVEEKMNTTIEALGKVDRRLEKLEDDRTSVWKEIADIRAVQSGHEKSLARIHSRLDNIKGGRD